MKLVVFGRTVSSSFSNGYAWRLRVLLAMLATGSQALRRC